MQSKIFTETEHKSLKKRLKGSKKDNTGIFSARIKPKIIEMLEYWFPQKKQLQKLVTSAPRRKNKKGGRASSH